MVQLVYRLGTVDRKRRKNYTIGDHKGKSRKKQSRFGQPFDAPHRKILFDTQFGGSLLNVISLNSEIRRGGKQTKFLKASLENHKDFKWQIPQYHRPIRPHVGFKSEQEKAIRILDPTH